MVFYFPCLMIKRIENIKKVITFAYPTVIISSKLNIRSSVGMFQTKYPKFKESLEKNKAVDANSMIKPPSSYVRIGDRSLLDQVPDGTF